MAVEFETLPLSEEYVFNHATKSMARTSSEARHSWFNAPSVGHIGADRGRFCEGWKFPVVDTFRDPADANSILDWNRVTFIFRAEDMGNLPSDVAVIGSFNGAYQPLEMARVADSRYWAVTLKLPAGRVFNYLYLVDGELVLDPVNTKVRRESVSKQKGGLPQESPGEDWSYFWTHYCREPVTFEDWEIVLLQRLTRHILPFNTQEGRLFIDSFNPIEAGGSEANNFRFDQTIGVVNYIDKLLAAEELHQRPAYKNCLTMINKVLRNRNPYQEPRDIDESFYLALYNDLAKNSVSPWDDKKYGNPKYFLSLLRRHTMMGAFSHPKYGGNVGGIGWAYLAERFVDKNGNNVFDWQRAQEQPLGTSTEYNG